MELDEKKVKKGVAQAREYWDKRAKSSTDDCHKVEQNERPQLMRYESFILNNDLQNTSILDVGCGVGSFLKHLQRREISCRYTGFDLSSEMIRQCKLQFKSVEFIAGDILEWYPQKRFDYVVSFGIHNIKVDGAYDILQILTKRQFELCNKAAHVSILTDRYVGFDKHIQAWRAELILELCLNITPYVALRHDYLPNDFSVTLYREPLIDTRTDLILEG